MIETQLVLCLARLVQRLVASTTRASVATASVGELPLQRVPIRRAAAPGPAGSHLERRQRAVEHPHLVESAADRRLLAEARSEAHEAAMLRVA